MHRYLLAAASLAAFLGLAGVPAATLAQSGAPSPAPSASPAAKTPVGVAHEHFVVGDYLFAPNVYNEFSQGSSGRASSYSGRVGYEFTIENFPFMVEGEIRDYEYEHFAGTSTTCPTMGCVTNIGHTGETFMPTRNERDTDEDGRIGFRIAYPRIYAVVSYLGKGNSNVDVNYPVVNGLGLGFEKIPDFERAFTIYGSGYYYPDLEGKFTVLDRTTGTTTVYTFGYRVFRYQAGVMFAPFNNHKYFIDAGILGDGEHASGDAPQSARHFAGYAGLSWIGH